MSWQTPGGDPPPDPAAPTPPDPVTPPPQTPVSDPTLGSPPPAAPTPGLISAAPVGWVGPERSAPPSTQAGGPEVTWAPPAPTPAVTMGEGLVVAGVFSRVVAYVIDLALLATVYFIVLAAIGGYDGTRMTAGFLAVSIFLLAADAIYFIALWRSSWHATVGMRLMGIRVLRSVDGGTLSFNAAAIRWVAIVGITTLLGFVPVLGAFATLLWVAALLLTTATQPIRQGLHDRWAGSVVLQPAPGGSGAAVIGCLVLIGLMLALPTALLFLWSDQIRDILSQVGNSI